MANVYVEPRPKGRREGTPIEDYILDLRMVPAWTKSTTRQAAAISAARAAGHQPLVARIRNTDKGRDVDSAWLRADVSREAAAVGQDY